MNEFEYKPARLRYYNNWLQLLWLVAWDAITNPMGTTYFEKRKKRCTILKQ